VYTVSQKSSRPPTSHLQQKFNNGCFIQSCHTQFFSDIYHVYLLMSLEQNTTLVSLSSTCIIPAYYSTWALCGENTEYNVILCFIFFLSLTMVLIMLWYECSQAVKFYLRSHNRPTASVYF